MFWCFVVDSLHRNSNKPRFEWFTFACLQNVLELEHIFETSLKSGSGTPHCNGESPSIGLEISIKMIRSPHKLASSIEVFNKHCRLTFLIHFFGA